MMVTRSKIALPDSRVAAPKASGRRPIWEYLRQRPEDKRAAAWMAAARRGAGRSAGSEPAMWPLYRTDDAVGADNEGAFEAEHICLVLYAFHQQSKDMSMHDPSTPWAAALRRLRATPRFTEREEALDAKVYAAATATSLGELQHHLRTLVSLMRTEGIAFNYTALLDDLIVWQQPRGPERIRRSWGREYYRRSKASSGAGVTTGARPASSSQAEQ